MIKNIKKYGIFTLMIFFIFFNFFGIVFGKSEKISLSSNIKNIIWGELQKEWYQRSTKSKIKNVGKIIFKDNVEDLRVDNDVIYNLNKKYLEKKLKDRKILGDKIDALLGKIKLKEIDPNTISLKYKRYMEIEDTINNADYIYVLALPIDKFLFKEDKNGIINTVVTRDPKFEYVSKSLQKQKNLKNNIDNEIKEIMGMETIEDFKKKIREYKSKYLRDYINLFVIKELKTFFLDLDISIAYRDNNFSVGYNYKNKELMNSLSYIPQKLRGLEKYTDKYFLIYIPLYYNNNVSELLKSVQNQKIIFKNSPQFCFKISYNDKINVFENMFCGLNEKFGSSSVKMKPLKIYYNNNFFIKLDKLGWLSILFTILIISICSIIPFFLIKYVDKLLNYGNKFETEQL